MKNKEMKGIRLIIIFILLIMIGNSCSIIRTKKLDKSVAKFEQNKRNKLEKIRKISRQYLETQIYDTEILNRIKFDTIFLHTGYFALYRVEDEISKENMIIVFVDNELEIDTINTVINSKKISQYLENSISNKLIISRKDAFDIAEKENFEKGIKPWKIQLVAYGGDLKNLRWNITNTISEGSFQARGKTLSINVYSKKIEYSSWQATS